MIIFKSPTNLKKEWNLYLKSQDEMKEIYYEDEKIEDEYFINGVTEFATSNVYIDKDINGFLFKKTIRHELMHVYLYDMGKNKIRYTEDEVAEIMSDAAPLICELTHKVMLQIKENK